MTNVAYVVMNDVVNGVMLPRPPSPQGSINSIIPIVYKIVRLNQLKLSNPTAY
jgi:hypothetical protein